MDSINFDPLDNEGAAFWKIEYSSFSTLRACTLSVVDLAQIWRYTIIGDCVASIKRN